MPGLHEMPEEYYTPGLLEMYEMAGEPDMSDLSIVMGYVPNDPDVTMCVACGVLPAAPRSESIFALCPGCCDSLAMSYKSDLTGMDDSTEASKMSAVWHIMSEKYGYEMMERELDKMFD